MSENPNAHSQLDITSEPTPIQPTVEQSTRSAKKRASQQGTSARVYFKCCRVYAVVRIPNGVLNGELSSWRFHCPRCGELSEIPL